MNILTFDIEEWFHVLDHSTTKGEKQWINFEYRLEHNLEKILAILEKYNQKATFFCLGWLIKNHKHLLKKIDSYGYEIATHSNMHQLVYEQKIEIFNQDLEISIKSLEDVTGKKVRAYRAPGFSLKEENRWVFESLKKYGIEIDCSIFPAFRAHGGFENFSFAGPSMIEFNSGSLLKELPMSLAIIAGKKIAFSGGGYFRAIPYPVTRYLMKNSSYNMTYFHPHDFDKDRPIIPDLSYLRKVKSKIGTKGALKKLEKLIQEFNFIDIDEADKLIDWSSVKRVPLHERRKSQRL